MYDDEYEPAPLDSYDLYARGLRTARCAGCRYAQVKYELGDKFLALQSGPNILDKLLAKFFGKFLKRIFTTIYELDAEPSVTQKVKWYKGRKIRRYTSFYGTIGHSDECYHWQPPARRGIK